MRSRSLALSFAVLLSAVLSLGLGLLSGASATAQVSSAEPLQASCGNGRCEPPEDCRSCERDCGSCCGNGRCEPPEDCRSCERDCGRCCGNGRCEPPEDENSCPRDCAR